MMNLGDKRWWRVLEIPFSDYGRIGRRHLGYIYGARLDAEAFGRNHPKHDTWGDVQVDPLYLEDVNQEIATQTGIRDAAEARLHELTVIRANIINDMGL